MRLSHCVITTALTLGLAGTAAAAEPADQTPQGAPINPAPVYSGEIVSHWLLAGFVGSNFGATTDFQADFDRSVDFGGQFGYLWHGMFGAELLADFAPNFTFHSPLLAEDPHVNAYMANAVGAIPLGSQGQYQPYISGGYGGIQMDTKVFTLTPDGNFNGDTRSNSEVKTGFDIGAGLMAFAGRIGIRGDLRYYRASGNNTPLNSDLTSGRFAETLASGLDFWRTNVGAVLRW